MCGIAGANLSPDENINAHDLSVALLLGIEERGRHATGAAFFDNGDPQVQKTNMPASEFVEYLDMAAGTRNLILHTRWATKGSPNDNRNNHPIDVRGIVGVHNGMVWNDDEVFDQIGVEKRIAEVDSEAIFASLLYRDGKITDTLSRIEGSAAVAWIDSYGDPEVLHVSRVSSSPLVYAWTEAGSFVFASTEHALRRGLAAVGLSPAGGPYTLSEGTYLRLRAGQVVSKASYANADRRWAMTAQERQALGI